MTKSGDKGDKARLIHSRNNWMTGIYKKARDAGVPPESLPEFCLAIKVGELFGEAMLTRLSSIPSDLFEKGHSTEKLLIELKKILEDKKILENKKKG
ncbi:MAG: hypothetical protein AAB726_01905 [Patescibacteria group bacterium]